MYIVCQHFSPHSTPDPFLIIWLLSRTIICYLEQSQKEKKEIRLLLLLFRVICNSRQKEIRTERVSIRVNMH
jgi:hypothetical protein